MSYQSLYRKYRPQSFNDVVGQDNIITTLVNAKENNKIGHAYIFSGPRGTGKTSIAKIFAKEASCTCNDNTCQTCEIYKTGQEISDVWEIDAASNNGVDEVRKIIENVNYMPMELKYKVYIIDEVHMLSKAAFNALLKTLEEPPAHVIFILATTEIHKIPLTILSRCQRFDFKRITNENIVERAIKILNIEEISYEKAAIERIAKLADGGMRDALSLIEKVLIYDQNITLKSVNQALQLVGTEMIEELILNISNQDITKTIATWNTILSYGVDENRFILDVQYYLRDLILKVATTQEQTYNKKFLIELMKEFNKLEQQLHFTNNFSLVIEVYLIDMASTKLQSEVKVTPEPEVVKPKVKFDKVSHQEKLKSQREVLLSNKQVIIDEPVIKSTELQSKNEQVGKMVQHDLNSASKDNQNEELPADSKIFQSLEKAEVQENSVIDFLIEDEPEKSVTQKNNVIEFLIEDDSSEKKKDSLDNQLSSLEIHNNPKADEDIEEMLFESFGLDNPEFNELFNDLDVLVSGSLGEETTEIQDNKTNFRVKDVKPEPKWKKEVTKTPSENTVTDNIIILDVLMSATQEMKNTINQNYLNIKEQVNQEYGPGLALFFDYSTLQAAGEKGYVITIDQNHLETYQKRIETIELIFNKFTNKQGKIFMMGINEWTQSRPEYVKQIQELKQKDIYLLAKNVFGDDIVQKI